MRDELKKLIRRIIFEATFRLGGREAAEAASTNDATAVLWQMIREWPPARIIIVRAVGQGVPSGTPRAVYKGLVVVAGAIRHRSGDLPRLRDWPRSWKGGSPDGELRMAKAMLAGLETGYEYEYELDGTAESLSLYENNKRDLAERARAFAPSLPAVYDRRGALELIEKLRRSPELFGVEHYEDARAAVLAIRQAIRGNTKKGRVVVRDRRTGQVVLR